MKKITILLFAFTMLLSCGLSPDDVKKMSKVEQVEYLNKEYDLNQTALNELTEEQFSELLDLHTKGVFDKKSLTIAWKEYANLNDEESKKYIQDNFQDYQDMNVILSFYGPRFHNK